MRSGARSKTNEVPETIPTEKDIAEAIKLLHDGDDRGMKVLYRAYQVKLIRVAYVILRDAELAKDAVQIGFWNAYLAIKDYDPRRPLEPWLCMIIANAAIDVIRNRNRLATREAPLVEEILTKVDPDPSFDERLEAAESQEEVWELLGELPEKQRAVIVLRYYGNFNYAEIAERVGCPIGTVRSRLNKAKQRLKPLLEPTLKPMELVTMEGSQKK